MSRVKRGSKREAPEFRGFSIDLIPDALENNSKSKVKYTSPDNLSQVVLTSLKAGEEIEAEVHPFDQTVLCVKGIVKVKIGRATVKVKKMGVVVIPKGEKHIIKNGSKINDVKLCMLYGGKAH